MELYPRQLLYEGNPQDLTVSQIKSAIAVNQDWQQKKLLTSVSGHRMNENYFKSLEKERLEVVAKNLHILAKDLWEKQQQNSENSSQPPSKDNPYTSTPTVKESEHDFSRETGSSETLRKEISKSSEKPNTKKLNRKPLLRLL
jgi:hypothetical protein